MRPEPPDTRFYAELRDLNLEFLHLIAGSQQLRCRPVFGLEAALAQQITRFTAPQIQSVAETRCLLAALSPPQRPPVPTGVAESPALTADPHWLVAARVFAAGLVTYAWHAVRRDPLRAALCLGPLAVEFRELGFRDAQRYSAAALGHLQARFHQYHRLWPDLIRAAREDNETRLHLARLSAVQLALSETATRQVQAAPVPVYSRAEAGRLL
jgi:hypothetical protein